MIGRTNAGGGGGLNFKVVGGTVQPENPKENTIWVNTDTEITSWAFSGTEPESPEEGMVWIATSKSSSVEFNALKKNSVHVYPISTKQYLSGAWVSVTATIYQNGAWADFWNGELYKNGNEYQSITGGWIGRRPSGYFSSNGSVLKNTAIIKTVAGWNQYIAAVTSQKIDLTNYNTLSFKVTDFQYGNGRYLFLCVFTDTYKDTDAIIRIPQGSIIKGINVMDISALKNKYYIGFGCASEGGTSYIEVSEVFMS